MRIVRLTAFHIRLTLKRPIRHALYERTATDNVLVRCELADGTVGYGEGLPREYVTGETIDTCLERLTQTDLAAQLDDCRDWSAAVHLADRLTLAGDRSANAARCAVELAILDAFGQHFTRPLSDVVPILAPSLYRPRQRVRYSGAIMGADGRKLRIAAAAMRIAGFRSVKVKVGIAGHDDATRLRGVRRYLTYPAVCVYVDANEAWRRGDIVDRLAELQPFQLAVVEQPVPHAELDCLAAVRRRFGIRIALDESACTPDDIERAVALGAIDVANVKMSKCGGFTGALRMAAAARRHGLTLQVSCQVGESALSSLAGRQFAAAVDGVEFVEGSYDRFLLRQNLAPNAGFGWGGWAAVPRRPGVGVAVDPRRLTAVTVRQVDLR
ncbi:MAG: enolase C-terminal domain-like protein [Gemmataceae bacterium]